MATGCGGRGSREKGRAFFRDKNLRSVFWLTKAKATIPKMIQSSTTMPTTDSAVARLARRSGGMNMGIWRVFEFFVEKEVVGG